MESHQGDVWLREWAKWIRLNEARLSDAPPHHPHGVGAAGTSAAAGGLGAWLSLGGLLGGGGGTAKEAAVPSRQRTLSTMSTSTPARPLGAGAGAGAHTHTQPLALRLDLHHLFYLLLRAQAVGLPVGPLDVRLGGGDGGGGGAAEASIPQEARGAEANEERTRPVSYISLLSARREEKQRQRDDDPGGVGAETQSISSVKSSFALAPSNWWGLGFGSSSSAKAVGNGTSGTGAAAAAASSATNAALADPDRDLKYVYSALTKIPSLRLLPSPTAHNGKLIKGYEHDCPGSTYAVPLDIFKNVHVLDMADVDPRQLLGWDRLAMQLRSLTCVRSGVEDVTDLLVDKVVDDARRRRGDKVHQRRRLVHAPDGPADEDTETSSGAQANGHGHAHADSGQGDTEAELLPSQAAAKAAASAPLPTDALPSLSWHFLRYLSLADNALTFLPSAPLLALSGLTHLDISSNLLNAVPPALAALPSLAVLNLSTNLLESVLGIYTLIPHIRVLNLSHNRLDSLCGLERLSKLRRIDLRHNELWDVGEIGRLADCEALAEVWVGTGNVGLFEERPDWRVECFVLFEQEGRLGVKIDGEGPGWLERGRIRERVPQTAKWKQAKAAADAEGAGAGKEKEAVGGKDRGAATSVAAALLPSRRADKGKAKEEAPVDGSEKEEGEAVVVGPGAYRAVVPRRAGRLASPSDGRGPSSSRSPPRAGALRSRRRGDASRLTDEDIDDDDRDEDSAVELVDDIAGSGRRLAFPRRESDASSKTGRSGVAARLLVERHNQAPRRRNRRLIDLNNNAGAGSSAVLCSPPLPAAALSPTLEPEAPKNASTMSIVSGSGVLSPGLAPVPPERASSPASIAVASRRGSVLPDPPADLRSAAAAMSREMSRTSTMSSPRRDPAQAGPTKGADVAVGEADADGALAHSSSALESDFSAMSDSEAIKRAVLQGRNDLAASPYVTAGPDGAPTEKRPPPAWMNSVGRKSGAGVKLGSTAVGQVQVLSPGESSAGEIGSGSPSVLSPGFGSDSNLFEDEVQRAKERQRRLSQVRAFGGGGTGGSGLDGSPTSTAAAVATMGRRSMTARTRPALERNQSSTSTGAGKRAPAGLAVPADTLAVADNLPRLGSPSTPKKGYQTQGRSSVARGGEMGPPPLPSSSPSSPRARPNADRIQARRSRVSLSMYDPPSPPIIIGGTSTPQKTDRSLPPGRLASSPPTNTSASLKLGPSSTHSSNARPTHPSSTAGSGLEASEAFRRRIEALKGEVGDDWLRLLVARNEQEKANASAAATVTAGASGSGATTGPGSGAGTGGRLVLPRSRKESSATKASRRNVKGREHDAGTGAGGEGATGGRKQHAHKAAVVELDRGPS